MDNRKRSSAGLALLCKMHARLRVQTDSDVPGVEDDVHQDTMASAVDYFGSVTAVENRTTLMRAVAEIDWLRSYVTHSPAQGTGDAQIQQYVLGVWRVNKTLTWEEMGNPAAQTCWD